MAGRKVFSEQEAQRCLAAARAAGITAGEWASQHGIDGRSLNAWRVNMARRGTTKALTGLKLVELVPTSPVHRAARYAVHVGHVTLEVSDDFNEATVRRLVAVLRSC